jgi:hypothetical protein
MKISKQIIYFTVTITAISGCHHQSNKVTENIIMGADTTVQESNTAQGVNANKETDSLIKTLQLKDISFDLSIRSKGSVKKLEIESKGIDTELFISMDGIDEIPDVHVADLNEDGFPELLIFGKEFGSGRFGNILAYSANGKKSMSQIHFPYANENPILKKGYQGHDHFSLSDSRVIQEFPLFKENDPNETPLGIIRRVQYKLVDRGRSRKFVVDNISEFPSK